MTVDVLAMLESQFSFLNDQANDDFLAQLGPYVDALTSDPRVRALLIDLVNEMRASIREFERLDDRTIAELVQIRDQLVRIAPGMDDSDRVEDPARDDQAYQASLAHFDRITASPREIAFGDDPLQQKDTSKSPFLLRILGAKVDVRDERFADLQRRLLNAEQHHVHGKRSFFIAARTSPGAAALRILRATASLNPEPVEVEANDPPEVRGSKAVHRNLGLSNPMLKALFRPESLENFDRVDLPHTIARLKREAKRLHLELLRRLHTTRSHRALIERFKVRTESYDRARMRKLTDGEPNPENLLVCEAARYLHDAGLNPLGSPQIGGLRPDLLDVTLDWTFYLEAKQYKSRKEATRAACDGAKQVWDTASTLKAIGVREVFLLIFRRGGPHCVVPDELRADGLTIYPIVVSIAPLDTSGSRQKEPPVAISVESMLPVLASSAPRMDEEDRVIGPRGLA